MPIRKAFLFKLRPNGEQRRKMAQFAGSCRFVYNEGLKWNDEQRKADGAFHFSYYQVAGLLPQWKKDHVWLKDTYSQCLQQALMDLGKAFTNFFAGRAKFPKPHKKFGPHDSFRYPQGFEINEAAKQIKLPRIGWVKYRRSRFITGKAKNVTVSRKADGWYVSVQTEAEIEIPKHQGNEIGIDMGVARFATLSDGTFVSPRNALKKDLEKLGKAQRKLSRMTKFGKNWRKQKHKIARIHHRIACVRLDFIEKVTLNLCKNHAVIYREDLKIRNMTASARGTFEEPGHNVKQKSGLNRAILDQAWGLFFAKLEWKATLYGGTVIKVPPQNTSRTCPACGHCSGDNRKTQAKFCCVRCGYSANADHVGAINILARGQRVNACGSESGSSVGASPGQQQEPIEAITGESL